MADAVVDATLPFLTSGGGRYGAAATPHRHAAGGVCMIRPCDVDAKGDVWRFTPQTHKTEHLGRERSSSSARKAQDVLRPYLLHKKASLLFFASG